MSQLLTMHDVCEKLKIKERTLRDLRKKPGFPATVMVGGAIRFFEDEIEAWIVAQREDTFVSHINSSGTIACKLVQPNFRTRHNGKNYAVFQTSDLRWHVRPFMTHVITGIDEFPIELSCEDRETAEIDWEELPSGAILKLSFEGDY